MDKYQKVILERCDFSINNEATVELDNNNLIVKQCENAYIKKFDLVIKTISLKSVVIDKTSYDNEEGKIKLSVDFDNKKDKIVLFSQGGIVDPIELNLVYIESDKNTYDEKVRAETLKRYKEQSNAHLIDNIFGTPCVIFSPCCDEYSYTEVEFIATNARGTTQSVFPMPMLNCAVVGGGSHVGSHTPSKPKDIHIILQRKKNEEGCNYIQFVNIGNCGLKAHIYQYDKKGNLLVDYEI